MVVHDYSPPFGMGITGNIPSLLSHDVDSKVMVGPVISIVDHSAPGGIGMGITGNTSNSSYAA